MKSNKTIMIQTDWFDTDGSDDNENLLGTYTITGNQFNIIAASGGTSIELKGEFSLTNNNKTLTLISTSEETEDGKVLRYVETDVYKRK